MANTRIRENMESLMNYGKALILYVLFSGRNAYFLEDSKGQRIGTGPVNGRFLKHYLT